MRDVQSRQRVLASRIDTWRSRYNTVHTQHKVHSRPVIDRCFRRNCWRNWGEKIERGLQRVGKREKKKEHPRRIRKSVRKRWNNNKVRRPEWDSQYCFTPLREHYSGLFWLSFLNSSVGRYFLEGIYVKFSEYTSFYVK